MTTNPTRLDLDTTTLGISRRNFPAIVFDEAHQQAWTTRSELAAEMNPAQPADSGYTEAARLAAGAGLRVSCHREGLITDETLAGANVLVISHAADPMWEKTTGVGSPVYTPDEISTIEHFVARGGGLVVLAEHEQQKYGNNLSELLDRFGVGVEHVSVVDPTHCHNNVVAWPVIELATPGEGLLARVHDVAMYRAGVLDLTGAPEATVVARTRATATPAGSPVIATLRHGAGRVVAASDSDLFGDDSIKDRDNAQLWVNLITWASTSDRASERRGSQLPDAWYKLVEAVEAFRPLQNEDGSVRPDAVDQASALVEDVCKQVEALAPIFPHDADYLSTTVKDLQRWAGEGFAIPDFLDSLDLFHPDRQRVDGLEHLVVSVMYTQNGNPAKNLEAVWIRTVWPEWLARVEEGGYDNPAFVPIEFIAFTKGYDTHSAVLFPETVPVREVPKFTWGAIFCDRESARFRHVVRNAARLLKLQLPPDAELLISAPRLAQETYVLWDLVHDRTHSHGDLPFDPFMIKSRQPFWMYALEELRCDLNAYVECQELTDSGVAQARLVRYAILLDRLLRFPVTGDRVRNYDGLGGQVLFAHLHRSGVLRWTDNTLRIDWEKVDAAVAELAVQVNALYRGGIDQSRVGYWKKSRDFVAGLVEPNPGSNWANGRVDLNSPTRELVDAVLADEFPLNVFYDALRKKLATTIEETKGMTL